ncbi:MAG: adenosylmethionine decarboxylase [Firmicutes bacterium]|nr:adenosylmethionine decarboxylase [Bacillota bacterium]
MNALGRHVLAEMYGCDAGALDSVEMVRQIMVDAATKAGAEIREVAFHKFSPQGVSGVVVISESHLAIHTWPEYGYAAVDVFTCGEKVDPWEALNAIADAFRSQQVTASEMKRGVILGLTGERVAAG